MWRRAASGVSATRAVPCWFVTHTRRAVRSTLGGLRDFLARGGNRPIEHHAVLRRAASRDVVEEDLKLSDRVVVRAAVAVAAIIGVALGVAAASAATSKLPTALYRTRCADPCDRLVGQFRVRPRFIHMLSEADGGRLQLRWRSWTRSRARGSGTSVVSNMGGTTRTPVRVKLWRPVAGRFTRLTVTYGGTSGSRSARYLLGTSFDNDAWVPSDICGNPDLDADCS